MKRLYLMRHGQTLFNLLDLNQGQCDSPLTALGIEQAKKAKKWFEDNNIKFDYVYSSTSERAIDTTEIITDMKYTKLKGLKEIYLGSKEATPNSENPPYPYGDYFVKYGGEDLDEFTSRYYNTILEIMRKENHNRVLIVSHGTAIKRFFTKIDYEAYDKVLGNCAIVILDFENEKFNVVDIINPN